MNALGLAALLLAVVGSQTPSPLTITSVASPNAAPGVFTTELQQVIRDQSSWQSLWSRLTANASPPPSIPAVDFTQEMLVVAAMGTKGHGGYKIAVTAATEQAGAVSVEVTETSPGPHCMNAMIVTSPVAIAKLPKRDGNVTFTVVKKTVDCQ